MKCLDPKLDSQNSNFWTLLLYHLKPAQKYDSYYYFSAVWGHLGTPNGTKKILKGSQVSRMYGPMS
jgi:hypothetical protein